MPVIRSLRGEVCMRLSRAHAAECVRVREKEMVITQVRGLRVN
jgi:hypothetical protein